MAPTAIVAPATAVDTAGAAVAPAGHEDAVTAYGGPTGAAISRASDCGGVGWRWYQWQYYYIG